MKPIATALDMLQGETGNQVTAGLMLLFIVVIKKQILDLSNSGNLEVCNLTLTNVNLTRWR